MTLQRMTMTLQEQARQSGLVLLNETAGEWNTNDWPPLEGGWRHYHASVVIHHPHEADDNNNHKGQTVVVMGGCRQGPLCVNSVLVLNLEDPDKQWREGPPMNKKRLQHAAVVCNGAVYVMGGYNGRSHLDCMERIDSNDLSAHESHWTTLTCRLSTLRVGCCAVAVQNRYIVVMGGVNVHHLSSVDIIDTRNHTVTEGPSMNVPRHFCASAVIGHRIFVVGGRSNSVEYLEFAVPCETKKATGSTFISFSTAWITYSDLVLSNALRSYTQPKEGRALNLAVARDQHATYYVQALQQAFSFGRRGGTPNAVYTLPQVSNCPDSVFVEDVVVSLPPIPGQCRGGLLFTTPGHDSRQGEVRSVQDFVQQHPKICHDDRLVHSMAKYSTTARCDGGDVVVTDRHVFVGIHNGRTNQEAVSVIQDYVHRCHYQDGHSSGSRPRGVARESGNESWGEWIVGVDHDHSGYKYYEYYYGTCLECGGTPGQECCGS